ncbi:co-chaperone GroES [Cetobacterium sp. SF1]|uniref:co-chaperone GroES n=1 Tax=Cetobacterium sp. SF1 TaxID=3417654 RepID=UPI003CFB3A53
MSIKPFGERILIKPFKTEEKTASGIILAGTQEKTMQNTGEVIAVGALENPAEIRIGDRVIYKKSTGVEVEENNEKYLILDLENILAIIEK